MSVSIQSSSQNVVRISAHRTAKSISCSIFFAGLSLIMFVLVIAVLVLITNNIGLKTVSLWLSRLQFFHVPLSLSGVAKAVLNGLLGVAIAWYFLVLLLCWAYNFVTPYVGYIRFNTVDTVEKS